MTMIFIPFDFLSMKRDETHYLDIEQRIENPFHHYTKGSEAILLDKNFFGITGTINEFNPTDQPEEGKKSRHEENTPYCQKLSMYSKMSLHVKTDFESMKVRNSAFTGMIVTKMSAGRN